MPSFAEQQASSLAVLTAGFLVTGTLAAET